jgi:hypothetical protein
MTISLTNEPLLDTGTAVDVFFHPKSIVVGTGRVLYAERSTTRTAGWVLPGGARTDSRDEAERVATAINKHFPLSHFPI